MNLGMMYISSMRCLLVGLISWYTKDVISVSVLQLYLTSFAIMQGRFRGASSALYGQLNGAFGGLWVGKNVVIFTEGYDGTINAANGRRYGYPKLLGFWGIAGEPDNQELPSFEKLVQGM